MVHFLPHWKFTIDSDKSPEEVRRAIEAETKIREGWVFYPSVSEDFIGVVEETSFEVEMKLPVGVYDSFEPMIVGQIQPQGSGARVEIRMRLRWDVFAVYAVGLGVTGAFFVICLLDLIMGTPDAWKGIAGAGGICLALQVMVWVGFYIPAKIAKRKLERLFGRAKTDQ